MYTVASPDPDPNPGGRGQLPNPNECNSTLMSRTGGIYSYPYKLHTDVDERGHRLRFSMPHRRQMNPIRKIGE